MKSIYSTLLLLLFALPIMAQALPFDWQGHRGCRGLMPENSIPAFIEALKYPVTTLELDIVISADQQIVVSHEPWMNTEICLGPDGASLQGMGHRVNLFRMTLAEIQAYDCGSLGNPKFPSQLHLRTIKPTLAEVVHAVRTACAESGREMPKFNIEIKSEPSGYNTFYPEPGPFVRMVLAEIDALGITQQVILQSFDLNVLREIHRQNTYAIPISYLVFMGKDLDHALRKLGFTPQIYSPHLRLATKKLIRKAHDQGIRVIPWTVNQKSKMQKLINRGVDGIITDYPNLIVEIQ